MFSAEALTIQVSLRESRQRAAKELTDRLAYLEYWARGIVKLLESKKFRECIPGEFIVQLEVAGVPLRDDLIGRYEYEKVDISSCLLDGKLFTTMSYVQLLTDGAYTFKIDGVQWTNVVHLPDCVAQALWQPHLFDDFE